MNVSVICSELVKIKSENPNGNTREVVDYLADVFSSLGISYKTTDFEGKCNIYTDPKKPLLFLGHVDTVPALSCDWDFDPFSGAIEDGYVLGRGSTDMKGGCASIIAAVSNIIEKKGYDFSELPCSIAFVCDEETGGDYGIRRLLAEAIYSPCDCIIAEPTPRLNPTIGQKGIVRCSAEFHGIPAHGSLYPTVGTSAVMKAVDFISAVRKLNEKKYYAEGEIDSYITESSKILSELTNNENTEDIIRKITYNPGLISGGEGINIVAQRCELSIEMRLPVGCKADDVADTLKSLNLTDSINFFAQCDPNFTDPKSEIVSILCSEVEKVYSEKVSPIIQWASSDGRVLRHYGFNAVEYGPGELDRLHAINERTAVKDLNAAAQIYEGVIHRYMEK